MPKETVKYEIERIPNGMYRSSITRKLNGEWKEMHREITHTMWGGKFHCKRWIKKWANGNYRQHSYMNLVTVDRKW